MNDERTTKHRRLVRYLDARGLEGALLGRRCNFSWYTGGAHNHVATACDVGASWLLVTRDRATVLANNIEAPRLREEELAGSGIEVLEYDYADPAAAARAFAEAAGGRKVASDAPSPWGEMPRLDADFDRLRWALTPAETERYRRLCGDTAAAVEATARAVRAGQTECAIAGALAAELAARDCTPWVLLVAADARVAAYRHPLPTAGVVRSYFMLVTCAERGGLIAACTRLAAFGPVPDDLARRHRAVATVDAALISATRPGASLGAIFAEGQAAYAAVGFPDEWRRHHQGGSCGYLPRDVKAGPGETTEALADQAFAWNPSIAGTKSEDTILCTSAGPQLLARPTDWPTVRAEWKGFAVDRPDILAL